MTLNGGWAHRAFLARYAAFSIAILALFSADGLCAQQLRDPMRPPSFGQSLAARPGPQTSDPNAVSTPPAPPPNVQLVKLSPNRKEATIDGRTVRVGQKVGDATLIDVSDSTVVLRSAAGERITLRLFPDSVKRRSTPTGEASAVGPGGDSR